MSKGENRVPASQEILDKADVQAAMNRSASVYDKGSNARHSAAGNKDSGKEPAGLPEGNSNLNKNKNKADKTKYVVATAIFVVGALAMAKCKSEYDNLPQFSGARLGSGIPTRPPVTQCYDQQLGKYINPGEIYAGTTFACPR